MTWQGPYALSAFGSGLRYWSGGGTLSVAQAIFDQSMGWSGWYLDPRFVWNLSGTFTGISNFKIESDMIGSIGWNGNVSYGVGYVNVGTALDGIAVAGATIGDAQGLLFEGLVLVGNNSNCPFHYGGGQRNCLLRDVLVVNNSTSPTSYGIIVDTALQGARNSEDQLFDRVMVVAYNPIGIGIANGAQQANDTLWNAVTTACTGPGSAITNAGSGANHTFVNFYDRTAAGVGVAATILNTGTGSMYFRGGELLNNNRAAGALVISSTGGGAIVLDGAATTAVTGPTNTVSLTAGRITVRNRSAPKGTWHLGAAGCSVDIADTSNSCGSMTITGAAGDLVMFAAASYVGGAPTVTGFTGTTINP